MNTLLNPELVGKFCANCPKSMVAHAEGNKYQIVCKLDWHVCGYYQMSVPEKRYIFISGGVFFKKVRIPDGCPYALEVLLEQQQDSLSNE